MAVAKTPRWGEDGFSLVESVVAIAILGVIVAAMVGGMATSISASDIHRQQSLDNVVMVSAAETIKKLPYMPCAPTYVPTNPLPTGWTTDAIRVSVKYFDPNWRAGNSNSPRWGPVCHDLDAGTLFPTQLVTIGVTSPSNRATTSVDIIKRRP